MFLYGCEYLASSTARKSRCRDRSSVSLFLVYNDMFQYFVVVKTLREEVFVATYQYIKCYFAVVKIRYADRSSVSLFLVYNDMFFFSLYSILCRCKTLREELQSSVFGKFISSL